MWEGISCMYKNVWIYFEVEGSRLKIPEALVSASASLNKQRKKWELISSEVVYASKKKSTQTKKCFKTKSII